MKKVTELKDGMKVWIPFDVRENHENEKYPFILRNDIAFGIELRFDKQCHYWIGDPPLEMYEQEEVPELIAKKMEGSCGSEYWKEVTIIGKKGDAYIDNYGYRWYHVRPIQKKVTLEIPEELLSDELRKYLKR